MNYPPVGEPLRSDDRISIVMYPAVGNFAYAPIPLGEPRWSNVACTVLVGPINVVAPYTQGWGISSISEAQDEPAVPPTTGGMQGWEPDALLRLTEQRSLPDDWDTYGGVAVTEDHARRAWQFLTRAMRPGLPLPSFIPLGDGGLQLEWDNGESQLSYTTEEGSEPEIWLSTRQEDVRLDEAGFFRALSAFRR